MLATRFIRLSAVLAVPLAMPAMAAGQAAAPAGASPQQAIWRDDITRIAAPTTGCYTARFPVRVWHRVHCAKPPGKPRDPAVFLNAQRSQVVGGGHDWSLSSPTSISIAQGSFSGVNAVSETDSMMGGSNNYTVQLNSNYLFTTGACSGIQNCFAWQQFIYDSGESRGFIESWTPSGFTDSVSIYVPQLPVSQLGSLVMNAQVAGGRRGMDSLTITIGPNAYRVAVPDNLVGLASNWTGAEFNVFGEGNGSRAIFSPGTRLGLVVQANGQNRPISCQSIGYTGESNNLSLSPTCNAQPAPPLIGFSESN